MIVFGFVYFILFILIWIGITIKIINLSFENFLSLFTLLGAWIAGIFAFKQWKETNKIKKAEYINTLTEKIRTDEDIRTTVYLFDYGENWYNENFHEKENREFERKIDKTLSYFSYICYLKQQKIILEKEFSFFRYEIMRILINENTQSYFFNLYHFSKLNKSEMTFKYLFNYGEKVGVFNSDFYNVESENYEVYLNIRQDKKMVIKFKRKKLRKLVIKLSEENIKTTEKKLTDLL